MEQKNWATLHPFFEFGDIVGRKIANVSFLHGLLQENPFDSYTFFLPSQDVISAQKSLCKKFFPKLFEKGHFHFFLQSELHVHIANTHFSVFHLSDPISHFAPLMHLRNTYAKNIFPITAVTHSLSYASYQPHFLAQLWQGVTPRDAIIATSRSAENMLHSTFSLLQERYPCEATQRKPTITRIPLALDVDKQAIFNNTTQMQKQRELTRKRFDLGESTVFLCLARISMQSKMDLMPLLQAMHRAQSLKVQANACTLMVAGWVENNDTLPEALLALAKQLNIQMIIVARPTAEECINLFAAADVFISPSDNIQETFGLTMLEAGGAGLPVIASDFDGYRDIIIHEETGLLIPTLGFATSAETNVLAGLWFDNQYHLKLTQQTAIDIPLLASAIAKLTLDVSARKIMGQKAKLRIQSQFIWKKVIADYVKLWETLADTPLPISQEALCTTIHPLSADFATTFRKHFTSVLDEATARDLTFVLTPLGNNVYRKKIPPASYAGLNLMLDTEKLYPFLLAARKPINGLVLLQKAQSLLPSSQNPLLDAERAAFMLLWSLKHDYIEKTSRTKD